MSTATERIVLMVVGVVMIAISIIIVVVSGVHILFRDPLGAAGLVLAALVFWGLGHPYNLAVNRQLDRVYREKHGPRRQDCSECDFFVHGTPEEIQDEFEAHHAVTGH